MMFEYIIKLIILIPLMGGLIFCMLWLYRKYQLQRPVGHEKQLLKIEQSMRLSAFGQLSVVEFGDKKILLSITKNNICKIAESGNDNV